MPEIPSIEYVEAEMVAIESALRNLRDSNSTMYQRGQATDDITRRLIGLRSALQVAMSDLRAFYRVADLLAERVAFSTSAIVAERAHIAASNALGEGFARRDEFKRIRALIFHWDHGTSSLDDVIEALGVNHYDVASAYSRWTVRTRVVHYVEDAAIVERLTDAIVAKLTPSPAAPEGPPASPA